MPSNTPDAGTFVGPQGLFRPLGRLRWPWRVVTVQTRGTPPLVCLNRRPRQVIGILFRLPDGFVGPSPTPVHYALSILWARPDVRAYPFDVVPPIRQRGRGWE
jgi:hypothetical protein